MQEKCPLLLVACGAQGIAAARAAITWDPVLALATEEPVVLLYLTASAQSAACMVDWNDWQQMGITIVPVYMGGDSDSQFSDTDRCAGCARLSATPVTDWVRSARCMQRGDARSSWQMPAAI